METSETYAEKNTKRKSLSGERRVRTKGTHNVKHPNYSAFLRINQSKTQEAI